MISDNVIKYLNKRDFYIRFQNLQKFLDIKLINYLMKVK